MFISLRGANNSSLFGSENFSCLSGPYSKRASINEMPAPDAVFVFIKISYKIFYNRFRVIRV